VNLAAGAKLWAERRAGELLGETVHRGRPTEEKSHARPFPGGYFKVAVFALAEGIRRSAQRRSKWAALVVAKHPITRRSGCCSSKSPRSSMTSPSFITSPSFMTSPSAGRRRRYLIAAS
jgi:hypothetical protein